MATMQQQEVTPAEMSGTSRAVELACARIAPAWPLDRMIAVNPWWGFVDRPIARAAADLAALSGAQLTMPRTWYRAQAERGALSDMHLARAIALTGSRCSVREVREALTQEPLPINAMGLMTDVVDAEYPPAHHAAWRDVVVDHVSQTCGAWFGDGQARWPAFRDGGLYASWRRRAMADASLELLMGRIGFREAVAQLPERPEALIQLAMDELQIPMGLQSTYLTALLMNVSGWASVCAFHRWEARLAGRDDDQIVHLLAVRLAWELVLHRTRRTPELVARWMVARRAWTELAAVIQETQEIDWILQTALELAYQAPLSAQLAGSRPVAQGRPAVHAVFCIDVRSEVMRRALEAAHPGVRTLGFAGFFGLPLAYEASPGACRPQLPGLLAPSYLARDTADATSPVESRQRRAVLARAWKAFTGGASSAFAAVEATGIASAVSMVRSVRTHAARSTSASESSRLMLLDAHGSAPAAEDRARLAAGILKGMSLTHDIGRILLIVGHGATTINNPQAAGLACGACGGQSGEVNARVLASLLNDPAVRAQLVDHGVALPDDTVAVPALHETVTDTVQLFDVDAVPASHQQELHTLRLALGVAGAATRRERAPRLGFDVERLSDDALLAAVQRRAGDWSEVRPEWGLARNAAFVIAPRERTRELSLDGRAFLHEYRWDDDHGFRVLEQILTAPMVVTNWINLQYYASTVDPVRYGSGDKVLHNVVGANVGVLEGAGGDLRIGLALQSVHNGTDWVHEPLRLSVYVEAPAGAIDGIMAKHTIVQQLVEHGWLHLFRIDPLDGGVYRRRVGGWERDA